MNARGLLKTLSIIHAALVIGLLVFCGIVFWNDPSFEASADSTDVFVYLVPIVALLAYFTSNIIYQKLIDQIERNQIIKQRLERYQMACIVKYAFIEAAALFALVAYYYQGNALHLVIAICIIAYLISQRPTVSRLQSDLWISLDEKRQLEL